MPRDKSKQEGKNYGLSSQAGRARTRGKRRLVKFLLIVSFVLITLVLLFSLGLRPKNLPFLSQSGTQLSGNISQQLQTSMREEGSYGLDLQGNCYWIRPSANGTHYLLKITEYASNNGCQGELVRKKVIATSQPIDIDGGGCFCGQSCRIKTWETEEYLKIEKQGCLSQ